MLRIGTSGYSFPDWRGSVYPQELASSRMLDYYISELGFDTVELNYTYYQPPRASTSQRMSARVPESFQFAVKAHRDMTHTILDDHHQLTPHPDAFKIFREGIAPLREHNQLACVLFQFPSAFRPNSQNLDYLAQCRNWMNTIPVVLEFRHRQWAEEATFRFLEEHQLAYCCVDAPALPSLMPLVFRVTGDIAYFRFHGRNRRWFNASRSERYNYRYNDDELQEFVPLIREADSHAPATYAFFNNCHGGSAAHNARRMKGLLGFTAPRGSSKQVHQLGLWEN